MEMTHVWMVEYVKCDMKMSHIVDLWRKTREGETERERRRKSTENNIT